jgi:hypothetical protein
MHPKADNNAKAIKYEWNMLDSLLARNYLKTQDTVLDNALLESFLIHFRALFDFFMTKPCNYKDHEGFDDDISAEQYFDLEDNGKNPWHKIKGKLFKETKAGKWEKKINKYLAHLTSSRREGKQRWPLDLLYAEVVLARKIFLDSVDVRVKDWFKIEKQV